MKITDTVLTQFFDILSQLGKMILYLYQLVRGKLWDVVVYPAKLPADFSEKDLRFAVVTSVRDRWEADSEFEFPRGMEGVTKMAPFFYDLLSPNYSVLEQDFKN